MLEANEDPNTIGDCIETAVELLTAMTTKPLDRFRTELLEQWNKSQAVDEVAAEVLILERDERLRVKLEEDRLLIEENERKKALQQERLDAKQREIIALAMKYEAVSDEGEEESEEEELSISEANRKRVADIGKAHRDQLKEVGGGD